jgi:sugar/nucleoside kinase (ribokinase family)
VLRYANAVAALNCLGLGARGGIAAPDDVERFMAAHSPGSRV